MKGNLFLAIFAICFGVFIGSLIPMDIAAKDGPSAATTAAVFIAVLVCAVGAWVSRRVSRREGLGVIITGVLIPVWTLVYAIPNARERIDAQVEFADSVSEFGQKYFGVLDENADRVIEDDELKSYLKRQGLTADEELLATHALGNIDVVGHVVGSYILNEVVVYVYGISREDLVTYPKRVRERHKHWQ